ncbi:MAG: septal ring lytic transglycosylase RlpA family lipoprotein [Comamonadaceae bacterium]|nr:septal ring lytic transglycosylase RlpA family lipoprotein [Comamonadaceae bacterium]
MVHRAHLSVLLAFTLAACAVPQEAPVPIRAAQPSAPPHPPQAPAQRGEPMLPSAPLDGGAAAPVAEVATAPPKGKPFAQGMASWYGPRFHGRRTASGERYDMHALTAAHRTLPFGTRLRVRSVHTGKEVVVRINDRGPYQHQRIIDLSRAAMLALGTLERGVTEVELLRE